MTPKSIDENIKVAHKRGEIMITLKSVNSFTVIIAKRRQLTYGG